MSAPTRYTCADCAFTTTDPDTLDEIQHFTERHQPGDVVADGQCPCCGALVFAEAPKPEAEPALSVIALGILDAVKEVLTHAEGMHGPEDYAALMAAVRDEAEGRRRTFTREQRREDWRHAVANGDTVLGLDDWIAHQGPPE